MKTAISPPTTAPTAKEPSSLTLFRERGTPHLMLAYHAALPLALTPDLLYGIWANFQTDIASKSLDIPWIAVSDLLLSGFCEVVGHELYKLDSKVRDRLLAELSHQPHLGEKRILELASFLEDKVRNQLNSEDPDIRDFAQAQKWVSLAHLEPRAAAKELTQTLSDSYRTDRTDLFRIASIVDALHEPLKDFPELISYAKGMASLAIGDLDEASQVFSKLHQSIPNNQICSVYLPQIKEIQTANQVEAKRAKNKHKRFSESWKRLVNFIKDPYSPPIIPITSAIVITGIVAAVSYTNNLFSVDLFINSSLQEETVELPTSPNTAGNATLYFETPNFTVSVHPRNTQAPFMSVYNRNTRQSEQLNAPVTRRDGIISSNWISYDSFGSRAGRNVIYRASGNLSNNQARLEIVDASSSSVLISQNSTSVRNFFLPGANPGQGNLLNRTVVGFDTQNHSVRVFNDSGVTKITVYNRVSSQTLVNGLTATAEATEVAPYTCWVNYFGGQSFGGAAARYFIRVSGDGQAQLDVIAPNGEVLLSEPRINSAPLVTNIPQADRPACFGESSSGDLAPYIAAVFGSNNELQQVRQILNSDADSRNVGGLSCAINPKFEAASQGQFINAAECGNRDDAEAIVSFLRGRGFDVRLISRNIDYQFDDIENSTQPFESVKE
ncbi:MAG: hypothetical protein KME14_04950 [Tildeniella torsiva UHER 1998/13D]|jgi:hypothetical protein|nr:hypothetical protein [Tildeniella torsiva UHER 1998/13D]